MADAQDTVLTRKILGGGQPGLFIPQHRLLGREGAGPGDRSQEIHVLFEEELIEVVREIEGVRTGVGVVAVGGVQVVGVEAKPVVTFPVDSASVQAAEVVS